jgi:hypothetical protein
MYQRLIYAVFLACLFFIPHVCMAQSVLLTIVSNTDNPQKTWWPEKSFVPLDDALQKSLKNYGIQTINPLEMSMIRFSPMVYAPGRLTSSNAKSLGGLFHADIVVNGTLQWACEPSDDVMLCHLTAVLALIRTQESVPQTEITLQVHSEAQTEDLAKTYAISMLASKLSAAYWLFVKSGHSDTEIPVYTTKPVLMLDAIPDADTLVALRKGLKRIDGVTDVTERFVTNGALALEINPEIPQMTFSEFEDIVYRLISSPQENFIVRETRRSNAGIGIEVVTY